MSETYELVHNKLKELSPEELKQLAEELDEMRWDASFARDADFWEKRGKEISAEHEAGLTEEIVCP
jgi:arsenate reductase-like glutaredoxin family protein